MYNLKCSDLENKIMIWADYYNEVGKHLLFSISFLKEKGKSYSVRMIEENEYKMLAEYSNENTIYYFNEDEKEYICVISGEYCYYKIMGNIELEELVKVRAGLYNII